MSSFEQNEEKYDLREKADLSENNQLNINDIKIIKRTLDNNTHEVLEDKRLKSVTTWRKSKSKFYKALIFNILTLGLLHWISLHYPNLYLKLYCNPWPAKECDFFLVENIYGQLTLCLKNHKKQKMSNMINSQRSEEKIINNSLDYYTANNLTYSFRYKSMKYEYKLEKNEIIPVYLDLSKMTNKTVINLFSEGISSKNLAEKIEERYGKNEYYINPNLLTLYFRKVQAPTFLIILCIGIGEIFLNDYSSFIIKLTFISFIIIIEYIYSKYTAYYIYKKENTIDGENKIKVKRKYLNNDKSDLYYEINNRDLLPGDILYLKIKDMVPCDCLLLEGECIVNQNHLNGNLGLLKKISIINNNEMFNYKLNNNNILLHGMKIIKIFSKIKEQYISALCINTGPNTYKANQYSNILYSTERKKGYKDVYQFIGDDRKVIIIAIFVLFFTSIILGIAYMFALKMPIEMSILKTLIIPCVIRSLFKSIMPGYYITHSMILLMSLFHLKRKNIFCYDKCRLLHSYNIDTIFISKTDIISESSFEVHNYNPVYISDQKTNNINYKMYNANQCKELNIELINYYKEYILGNIRKNKSIQKEMGNSQILRETKKNKNKSNVQTNKYIALFIECLLSCNNIEKKNNEIFGNVIEANIFYNMKWEIKTYDYNYYCYQENNNKNKINDNINISNNNNLYYNCKYSYNKNNNYLYTKVSDIFPKNYYEITEDLKLESNHKNNFITKKIISSDDDSSKKYNKSNRILRDISKSNINSYKLRIYKRFIKDGSLISSAIVYNFITKELRFMTKGIPEDILDKCNKSTLPENFEKIISMIRMNGYIVIICGTKIIDIKDYNDTHTIDYYMNNLIFCGFITLKNKIKNEVNNCINELKNYDYNLILISGDNLFNCINDGYKSGIIEKNKNIFVIDKNEQNKILINKLFNIKNIDKKIKENTNINSESLDKYSKTSKKIVFQNEYSNDEILENSKEFSKNLDEENERQISITPKILFKTTKNNKSKSILQNSRRSSIEENFKNGNIENNLGYNKRLYKFQRYLKFKKVPSINLSNGSEVRELKHLEQKKLSNKNLSPESKYQKGNKDKKNKNVIKRKTNLETYLEKHYYYPNLFEEYEDLNDCIYCINGETFTFLYNNKNKKQYKYLLSKIHKNCKVYYDMSSIDKSLSVEFFREINNSSICYIGKSSSDCDAIITANVGIFLDKPKNQNTILCHFCADKPGIYSLKHIICEGKAIYENIIFLKIASIFSTMVINSFILCCFICHIDVTIGQLNLLEILLIIFSISAFTSKTNNKLENIPFINNSKFFICFYITQIIGLFLIKLFNIYIFCSNYHNGPMEDYRVIARVFCSFYFILCMELIFSSIVIFNYNSFFRNNFTENKLYINFIIIFFLYLSILISLNSSNYRIDIFNVTYFEYLKDMIDSYSDRNKVLTFNVFVTDFGVSFVYSRIIYYVFDKIILT